MTPQEFKNTQARLGLTSAKMADLLGCSASLISKYRRGVNVIPKDTGMALKLLIIARDQVEALEEEGMRYAAQSLKVTIDRVTYSETV